MFGAPGYLCPPVPQRVDYLHIMADLLRDTLKEKGAEAVEKPPPRRLFGLDIGTGVVKNGQELGRDLTVDVLTLPPNITKPFSLLLFWRRFVSFWMLPGASCIYSLLGAKEYGWRFIASDIDDTALQQAGQLVTENGLEKQITLRCLDLDERLGNLIPSQHVHDAVSHKVNLVRWCSLTAGEVSLDSLKGVKFSKLNLALKKAWSDRVYVNYQSEIEGFQLWDFGQVNSRIQNGSYVVCCRKRRRHCLWPVLMESCVMLFFIFFFLSERQTTILENMTWNALGLVRRLDMPCRCRLLWHSQCATRPSTSP